MSSKPNREHWWSAAGEAMGLLAEATGLGVPILFAYVIFFLLAPFAWLAWYWWGPAKSDGTAPPADPATAELAHRVARSPEARRPFGVVASTLASLFFAAWAMVFAALAILLFVALLGAIFGPSPGYGMALAVGCLCAICGWFAWQIGSAIRA